MEQKLERTPTDDDLRRFARAVHGLTAFTLIALVVLVGVNHAYPAGRALVRVGDGLGPALTAAAPTLITMLPLVFFAEAANRLRQAFGLFADGRYFETAAAQRVRQAGIAVASALVASVLIVPNLLRWTAGQHGGLELHVEPTTAALFCFALFIIAIGRVLEQAAALKADHDAIV